MRLVLKTMPDHKVQLAWVHPLGIEGERGREKLHPQPPPLPGIRHLLERPFHIPPPHKAGHFFVQCLKVSAPLISIIGCGCL